MTAQERRNAILSHLQRGKSPLSATALAGLLGVSRQVIVGDVALLRAGGVQIVSTSRGYLIPPEEGLVRQVVCQHTPHQTQEELYAMVDGGCTVLDVTVEHPVYGQLTAPLHASSRYDVAQFLERCRRSGASPLSNLTGGVHLHTVACPDEDAARRVADSLRQLGFLYEPVGETP